MKGRFAPPLPPSGPSESMIAGQMLFLPEPPGGRQLPRAFDGPRTCRIPVRSKPPSDMRYKYKIETPIPHISGRYPSHSGLIRIPHTARITRSDHGNPKKSRRNHRKPENLPYFCSQNKVGQEEFAHGMVREFIH